jgi:hypothetical protein
MTTLIENLKNKNHEICEDDEFDSLSGDIKHRMKAVDLFSPLDVRINSLLKCPEIGELISTIVGMYFFSRTKRLKEYIMGITSVNDIPIIYRIECAKSLRQDDDEKDDDIGFFQVNKMFEDEELELSKLPTPMRVDTVFFLMKSQKYSEKAREYFCRIIGDKSLDILYRFKTIQSLENKFTSLKELFLYYAREATERFINDTSNFYTYRVIACQYLFEKCDPTVELQKLVQNFLLDVAGKVDLDQDIKADACDILLQYGDEDTILMARNILFILGGVSANNIFKNSQNVHVRSVEESVEKIIDKLSEITVSNKEHWDFDKIQKEIIERYKDANQLDEIKNALVRIHIDRATYGRSNLTLQSIFVKMWVYVQSLEDLKDELTLRIVEEIVDANNKCSSGYASRIVNVLSGFIEGMGVSISFDDQITANLEGRLSSRIRKLEDEDFMGLVLEEMMLPTHLFDKRMNFLKFFMGCISQIREEMYQEFREFMEDHEFDMYFRKALISFEGCK